MCSHSNRYKIEQKKAARALKMTKSAKKSVTVVCAVSSIHLAETNFGSCVISVIDGTVVIVKV